MPKENPETKSKPSTNNNKNTVRVNNNFNLTINLGDSLNILALIGGIYLIRTITKNKKQKTKTQPRKNVMESSPLHFFLVLFLAPIFLVPVTIYALIHILTEYLFFALK